MIAPLPFEEWITQDLANHFGGVAVTLEGPVSIRDYSQIYRAHVHTSPATYLAVKRCLVPRTTTPDTATALDQYAALARVGQAMRRYSPRYFVPEPIFVSPEMATLAMSWVGGKPLTNMLRHPAVLTRGAAWFSDVGTWLGYFHAAGPARVSLFDCEARKQNLSELQASPLPNATFMPAVWIATNHLQKLSGLKVHASWLHGDCKTDNFMIDGKSIYAIDVSLKHENAVEYDLAQFLNHLDLNLLSPQSILQRGFRSAFARAFLRGYEASGLQISRECLEWTRLWAALALWRSTLLGRATTGKTWILDHVFSSLVRDRCKALTGLSIQS